MLTRTISYCTSTTITIRIPKLRRGTYFPDGLVERWSRVDRVVICAVAEMYALGVSTSE